MKRNLSQVGNPQGRADVLVYRLAERWMAQLEAEQGLTGMREGLLPLVEQIIADRVPAENVIPRELRALMGIRRGRRC